MNGSRAAAVIEALRERGWTLGVAESLTGGAVCAELVSVPGASEVLLGGIVAYATPLKHSVLGVDAELLARQGPVHPAVALQMATGVRRAVGVDGRDADVGISTTGVAGPGAHGGVPAGTVHVGVVSAAASKTRELHLEGDRAAIRARTVDAVLDALLETLAE
ncbi:CinA family protein [Microbacterium sp. 179-I 3D3 NHS]|uniref:CinA family protein n=1 Tax=Microbacterium sp. 179-I 3D3 NHS TaxID=3142382 RepID=UPI0039A12F4E